MFNLCDDGVWSQMTYRESIGGQGKLLMSPSQSSKNPKLVPCFPLHALLLALNQSTVDYFSLDVEGFELEVRPTSSDVIGRNNFPRRKCKRSKRRRPEQGRKNWVFLEKVFRFFLGF